MAVRTSRWPSPPVPGGFGFPLGFAAGILVTVVAVAAGATSHPSWSLIALAVAVAGVSAVSTASAALATTGVCWALHVGFVLGRRGDLVFNAMSRQAAVVLVLTASTVVVVAAGVRVARAWCRASMHNQIAARIPAQRDGTTPPTAGRPGATPPYPSRLR